MKALCCTVGEEIIKSELIIQVVIKLDNHDRRFTRQIISYFMIYDKYNMSGY